MARRTSVGRRAGAVVFTLLAACSAAPADPAAVPPVSAQRNGPIPSSATEGTFSVERSSRSIDQLDIEATGLPSQGGELVELRSQATGALVLVAVEKGKPVAVRDGWSATAVHADRVWSPAHCANLPHVLLGGRHLVILRDSGEGRAAMFEVFDLNSRQFLSAPLAADETNAFTLSLKAEGAATFSVLVEEKGVLVQRHVDVASLRYRDLPVATPVGGRVTFARSMADGYLIDAGAQRGVRVQLDRSTTPGRLVPATFDETLVIGQSRRLSIVAGAAEYPLPAEVLSASIAGERDGEIFVAYSTSTSSIAEAIGVLDRSTGGFRPVAGPQPHHLLVVAVAGGRP